MKRSASVLEKKLYNKYIIFHSLYINILYTSHRGYKPADLNYYTQSNYVLHVAVDSQAAAEMMREEI